MNRNRAVSLLRSHALNSGVNVAGSTTPANVYVHQLPAVTATQMPLHVVVPMAHAVAPAVSTYVAHPATHVFSYTHPALATHSLVQAVPVSAAGQV